MFGLEGKNKKTEGFVFDLEKEAKDPKLGRELKDKIIGRIRDVKAVLRGGQEKEDFDRFGQLLHGYTALQKVLSRVTSKK